MSLLQDHFASTESYSSGIHTTAATSSTGERDGGVHILNDKLEIPYCAGLVERPRLIQKLERSLSHFAVTLVCGRAGTGKTSMAAAYARTRKSAAWFTVESSDIHWHVFASHLAASVLRGAGSRQAVADSLPAITNSSPAEMAIFLRNIVSQLETEMNHRPLLVLDGIHHLFDAEWFREFFIILQPSFSEIADLLLLCRSKPPNPLWRLRSKQQLDVIDEKTLAFDRNETILLLTQVGRSQAEAARIHAETFGRVSKVLPFIRAGKPSKPRL